MIWYGMCMLGVCMFGVCVYVSLEHVGYICFFGVMYVRCVRYVYRYPFVYMMNFFPAQPGVIVSFLVKSALRVGRRRGKHELGRKALDAPSIIIMELSTPGPCVATLGRVQHHARSFPSRIRTEPFIRTFDEDVAAQERHGFEGASQAMSLPLGPGCANALPLPKTRSVGRPSHDFFSSGERLSSRYQVSLRGQWAVVWKVLRR